MGCYDGAEICELVGLYIQHKLSTIINKNDFGLYRDDGLGILHNTPKSEAERIRKKVINIFKECDLSITSKVNLKFVDFLDVRFNLEKETYEPFRKPNNTPVYISTSSNHPPNIIKELPKSISKRLSEISCNEDVFNSHVALYQDALCKSGYKERLTFNKKSQSINDKEKRKRKRNILWYNPPYSKSVKTNIGKEFFKLLNKHFPNHNALKKIFNKNTVKLSYSCFSNVNSFITSHNRSLLHPREEEIQKCNCKKKDECPMKGNCQIKNIIYRADISNDVNDEKKFYIGLCAPDFKGRYNNHTRSFRHKKYMKETELAKYIWDLQDRNITPKLEWSIVKKVKSKTTCNSCPLCLTEKLMILNHLTDPNMLNKRSEFISKCRHQRKLLLCDIKCDSMD